MTDVVWHPFAVGEGLGAGGAEEGEMEDGEGGVVGLATGCADGTASLWTREGRLLGKLEGHTDRCGRIAFHPMGRHLVSPLREESASLCRRSISEVYLQLIMLWR